MSNDDIHLYHFAREEFVRAPATGKPEEDWWPRMDPRLLVLLDVFRTMWGRRVSISPAAGAIGRYAGDGETQHNIARYGSVRAVDVMPEGLSSAFAAREAAAVATDVGWTGIGVYPHWRPRPGLHLDVRRDRRPGAPAMWGAVRETLATDDQRARGRIAGGQVYLALDEVIDGFA